MTRWKQSRWALALWAVTALAQYAPPVFEKDAQGLYRILSTNPNAVIRYTFENKEVDRSAGVYLAPVRVPAGRTLQARVFSADGATSSPTATLHGDDETGKDLPSSLLEVTQNRDWRNYDWATRHRNIVARNAQTKPRLLFLGDSITHFWGGEPHDARARGADSWDRYYAPRQPVNLGYGWDRTENVLWRLRHGEIDGISPQAAVIMIGTNNMALNTPEEIAAGVKAICDELLARLPQTNLILLGIFPRGAQPDATRAKVEAVNALLAPLGTGRIQYLDIGKVFLEPDGSISPQIMNDYLHPTAAGYARWAEAMEPTLRRALGEPPQ